MEKRRKKQSPHGIGVFANDFIYCIDGNEYPYFVFKNNSADDNVEFWFSKFDEDADEKSIKDWNRFLAEFVVIENGKIIKFISNLDYQYE